jgi:predicted O-methyltransferase YrrM
VEITARHWLRPRYARLARRGEAKFRSLRFRIQLALLVAGAWLAGELLCWWLLGNPGLVLGLAALLAVTALLALDLLSRLQRLADHRVQDDRNLQALLGLYATLRPETALPVMRGTALSPDTCLEYLQLLRRERPSTVVELGSGVSTLIAGYQVKRNGHGRVIALDHEECWAEETRRLLEDHGLSEFAEVRIAPLEPVTIGDQTIPWYDLAALEEVSRIDVLLVDGPPDHYGLGVARRPGLEMLRERLSEDAAILLDDCALPGLWGRWVRAWAESHGFSIEAPYLNEKGALILRSSGVSA